MSSADLREPTSSINDETHDQEKGNQDHDTTKPIFSLKLRSTLARDKIHTKIGQTTKKKKPTKQV